MKVPAIQLSLREQLAAEYSRARHEAQREVGIEAQEGPGGMRGIYVILTS